MPNDEKEEVNQIEETLEPKEEEEEDEEDEAVPALEEEPSERDIDELKSASEPSPDETNEKPQETETEDGDEPPPEEEDPVLEQPKPVEGETPREKALRLKVQELRERIRNKDEVIKTTPPPISNEEYDALKEIYTEEELEKVEKLFEVIGKKKGYVKAEEIYARDGNQVLEDFLDDHPEYKPENDVEDVRWNKFKQILTNDYNRSGKQPKELARIFKKVHRDVQEEFGESPKVISHSKRKAQVQKVRSVSHAGGAKKEEVKKESKAPTDPGVRKMFKDFDDDDF